MSWEVWAMTLATSLFNKGVFKNTLKRFKWGSILYFVILFFAVPFTLMVTGADMYARSFSGGDTRPLLLDDFYIGFPIFMALIVPTIVAVLVQNNVHSAKQGIFMHGLPVSRKATYISQLAASGVLMAAPVVANAIILLIMSLTTFDSVITSSSVVYWLAQNLTMQFVMFSIAVFAGFLTGNAAAHIGINIFLHLLPSLVALIIFLVSDIFLYGFSQSNNFIANQLMEYSPVVWLCGRMWNYNKVNLFTTLPMWLYIAMAIAFYALGFVVYTKRRIEACGDVAAFKVFRPILKYAVVAAAVSAIFGIFTSANIPAFAIYFIAAATGAVVYFAAEMLLSKSVKVFGRYKGYLGFMAFTAAFISFFAFTSVCGYETRVPDKEDIASATIYEWSNTEPVLEDSDFIDDCIALHKKFIADIPVSLRGKSYANNLYVVYKLKNGKELKREYQLSKELSDEALSKMYEYPEYKIKMRSFDMLNVENVDRVMIDMNARGIGHTYTLKDAEASALLEAIGKDLREISYEDMQIKIPAVTFGVNVGISKEENDRLHYFKDEYYGDAADAYYYRDFSISLNANFKHTFEFLKEKGYYNDVITRIADDLAILKEPVMQEEKASENENVQVMGYSYKGDYGEYREFQVSTDDLVYLSDEDAYAVAEMILITPQDEAEPGEYYYLYCWPESEKTKLSFHSKITAVRNDKLPDMLKKYLD